MPVFSQPVFFGGEHTSTDRFGTVDGAFLSGVRAALWATSQLQQVSCYHSLSFTQVETHDIEKLLGRGESEHVS